MVRVGFLLEVVYRLGSKNGDGKNLCKEPKERASGSGDLALSPS